MMINLNSALGLHASTYEAIALKVIGLIDGAGASLEVGRIALKTAQLILDARERDEWEATWDRVEKTTLTLARVDGPSQGPQRDYLA